MEDEYSREKIKELIGDKWKGLASDESDEIDSDPGSGLEEGWDDSNSDSKLCCPPPPPEYCNMGYKEEVISKDVLQSWRETVEPHFRELGFDFSICEVKRRLILKTNGVECPLLIARAKAAFSAIAYGFSSLWIKAALDQRLYFGQMVFAPA